MNINASSFEVETQAKKKKMKMKRMSSKEARPSNTNIKWCVFQMILQIQYW